MGNQLSPRANDDVRNAQRRRIEAQPCSIEEMCQAAAATAAAGKREEAAAAAEAASSPPPTAHASATKVRPSMREQQHQHRQRTISFSAPAASADISQQAHSSRAAKLQLQVHRQPHEQSAVTLSVNVAVAPPPAVLRHASVIGPEPSGGVKHKQQHQQRQADGWHKQSHKRPATAEPPQQQHQHHHQQQQHHHQQHRRGSAPAIMAHKHQTPEESDDSEEEADARDRIGAQSVLIASFNSPNQPAAFSPGTLQRRESLLQRAKGVDLQRSRLNPFPEAESLQDLLQHSVSCGLVTEAQTFAPSVRKQMRDERKRSIDTTLTLPQLIPAPGVDDDDEGEAELDFTPLTKPPAPLSAAATPSSSRTRIDLRRASCSYFSTSQSSSDDADEPTSEPSRERRLAEAFAGGD